jgi:hypothetical protein
MENHLLVKGLLNGMEIIEQTCVVVSPIFNPVPHDFSMVLANIIQGRGNGEPIFIIATANLRGPPTDQTRAVEVVARDEESLAFVRDGCRPHNFVEIGYRHLFPS